MLAASRSARGVVGVRVLEVDPDLADVLDEDDVDVARYALVAPAITLAEGEWSPRRAIPANKGHIGVLVTKGILCREVAVGESVCAELVGPGDLLRPWDGASDDWVVSCDVRWQVLEEAQLAVLGHGFATAAARWPVLTSALVARAVNRSHALALAASISCTTGVERRLLMLFWHLADRWGKVRGDGVVVPVQMTHELIARLIGARRPSVSTALKRLSGEGSITRIRGAGWLLAGVPPAIGPHEGLPAGRARRAAPSTDGHSSDAPRVADGRPQLEIVAPNDAADAAAQCADTDEVGQESPSDPDQVSVVGQTAASGSRRSTCSAAPRRRARALQASQ